MYKHAWLVGSLLSYAISFNVIASDAKEANVIAADAKEADEAVLATVNDSKISQQDYNDYVGIPPGAPSQPRQDFIVTDLINRELVVQAALKQDLDKDADFLKRLEKIKYNALFEFAMEKYHEKHPIGDERLRQKHKKFKPLPQYKVRHILVKTRDEAAAIIAEIQQGRDFTQLAMQRSLDPTTRHRGGDLGWLVMEQMFEQIARVVTGMAKGNFTTQPIQTQVGWHVVLLEDTRELPPIQFEAARPQLSAIVRAEMAKEYFTELKKQAEVEILNK